MIRVAALTSGRNVPSSRFRVRQFLEPLRRVGIDVTEYPLAVDKYGTRPGRLGARALTARKILGRVRGVRATRGADVTWLERELVPGRLTLEGMTRRPRVFDVDDALWLNGVPGFSERIARLCEGVIAGNEFLAAHYREAGVRVWVIPTSIDTEVWSPGPTRPAGGFTIGWIGTSSNLPFLRAIVDPLTGFLRRHAEARLLVVSDREPEPMALPDGRLIWKPWSAEAEVALVRQMDVGLMPLPDTDWARGKCSCKMLSYMAVGIPVVVSPVGTNAEVLLKGSAGLTARREDDWAAALETLRADPDTARKMGAEGRRIVEQHFSVEAATDKIASVFREVAGGATGPAESVS